MSTRFRLSRKEAIHWPRKCALCGAKDVIVVETYASKLKSVMPFILWTTVKWNTQPLSFSVCSRHKTMVGLVHFFAPRSLVWFFLFLWTAAVVIDALTIRTFWDGDSPIVAPYLVLASAGIVWLRIVAPVTVSVFDDESLTLSFRSSQYAEDFEAANSNAILEKNGYAYDAQQK